MFESVRAGLRRARDCAQGKHVLLHPSDHPEVLPSTLDLLLTQATQQNTKAVMPEFHGRGGHPVVIPPCLVEPLIDAQCPQGLRQYWLEHPDQCLRTAVQDQAVVFDIDSPQDCNPGLQQELRLDP